MDFMAKLNEKKDQITVTFRFETRTFPVIRNERWGFLEAEGVFFTTSTGNLRATKQELSVIELENGSFKAVPTWGYDDPRTLNSRAVLGYWNRG